VNSPGTAPLLPIAAMAALTAVVWVAMFAQRIGEFRERRVAPQSVATRAQVAARLSRTNVADNFANLFEMPALFYAWCLCEALTTSGTAEHSVAAWCFVALRFAHSAIHCTYNNVNHRFVAYAASSWLLFGLWGTTAMRWLA